MKFDEGMLSAQPVSRQCLLQDNPFWQSHPFTVASYWSDFQHITPGSFLQHANKNTQVRSKSPTRHARAHRHTAESRVFPHARAHALWRRLVSERVKGFCVWRNQPACIKVEEMLWCVVGEWFVSLRSRKQTAWTCRVYCLRKGKIKGCSETFVCQNFKVATGSPCSGGVATKSQKLSSLWGCQRPPDTPFIRCTVL